VFIPLAERSGQIHAIGAWVIEESCRQLVAWRQRGLQVPKLAINLSATQLCLPDGELARTLIATVRRHGLEPEAFELEITETALIHDPETSREETMALHRAGFQLAIDDFGTGYASLVSLHLLPVDKIKIDLSFIQRLQANETDHTIVKSTILLAQELGLQALAEGVETEEQWRILQELGCDLFQGYLFGFPMAAEAFEERLRATAR
jgi:EAL domain-containing protein (putative c-di-GMP-specific phosphodiesterase class I)